MRHTSSASCKYLTGRRRSDGEKTGKKNIFSRGAGSDSTELLFLTRCSLDIFTSRRHIQDTFMCSTLSRPPPPLPSCSLLLVSQVQIRRLKSPPLSIISAAQHKRPPERWLKPSHLQSASHHRSHQQVDSLFPAVDVLTRPFVPALRCVVTEITVQDIKNKITAASEGVILGINPPFEELNCRMIQSVADFLFFPFRSDVHLPVPLEPTLGNFGGGLFRRL